MTAFPRLRAFANKVSRDEVIDRSSGLAFQMLSSLLPMLALAYYLFAQLNGFQKLKSLAERYALQSFAPGLGQQLIQTITQVQDSVSPSTIGVFGIVGFFYAGIIMIAKVESYLNLIWEVPVQRPWRQRALRYAAFLIFGPLLLGASLSITSFIVNEVPSDGFLPHAFDLILLGVPYLFSSALFYLMYRYLPHTRVSRRAAWRGGLITGFSFEVLKQGFAFYAHYALSNSVYGSLATLPILVIWISLVATVIMIGGEVTCYFDRPSLF